MSVRFRLLTEADVQVRPDDGRPHRDDDVGAASASRPGRVVQPVRPTIPIADDCVLRDDARLRPWREQRRQASASLPGERAALGAKLVTVFGGNAARGLHSHLASIVLLDPETGALLALLDGRYITEARTAAVSAVSSRLLARKSVGVAGHHRHRRPGAEPSGRAVARARAPAGDGLEPEQGAPRPVRRDDATGRDQTSESDAGLTASYRRRPRRRGGRRRRHHRPRDLVADAGPRERLGEAGRARDLGRRLPAQPARDGPRARRARAAVRRLARRRARRVR